MPEIPSDPACKFCGEVAMVRLHHAADRGAFWCGTCGALAEFRHAAPGDDPPAPESYSEGWRRPIFAADASPDNSFRGTIGRRPTGFPTPRDFGFETAFWSSLVKTLNGPWRVGRTRAMAALLALRNVGAPVADWLDYPSSLKAYHIERFRNFGRTRRAVAADEAFAAILDDPAADGPIPGA